MSETEINPREELLTWDLIPVSREEFDRRKETYEGVQATVDNTEEFEEDFVCHYTDRDGLYVGTIKVSDDGAEYLVPEKALPDWAE